MFTRDRAFYFTTVFIPGIILVTSSFITFWLEWNAVPARVMIGKWTTTEMAASITRIRGSPLLHTQNSDRKSAGHVLLFCVSFNAVVIVVRQRNCNIYYVTPNPTVYPLHVTLQLELFGYNTCFFAVVCLL